MYPSSLPLSEIQNIVRIVRAGDLISSRAALAHDVWIVQGYAQSQIIGDPSKVSPQSAEDPFVTLEKIANDAPSAQSVIDWTPILQYLIKMIIELYLKDQLKIG